MTNEQFKQLLDSTYGRCVEADQDNAWDLWDEVLEEHLGHIEIWSEFTSIGDALKTLNAEPVYVFKDPSGSAEKCYLVARRDWVHSLPETFTL